MTTDEADEYAVWWRKEHPLLAAPGKLDPSFAAMFDQLGLAGRVEWDAGMRGWRITAWSKPQKTTVTIDEEVFVHGSPYRMQVLDLIVRKLEDLQLCAHDAQRAFIASKDVKGRHQALTREDRHTLHEMHRDAIDRLYSRYVYTEQADVAVKEKQAACNAVFAKIFK